MAERAKRVEVCPTHLEWLAKKLKLESKDDFTPDLVCLLENIPSGLYCYPPGEDIVREGERGTDLYVIYSGNLAVWRQEGQVSPVELGTLYPGDFFGEIGFLMHVPRSATVRTTTECQLFKFSAEEFEKLTKKYKKLENWIKTTAKERLEKIFLNQL